MTHVGTWPQIYRDKTIVHRGNLLLTRTVPGSGAFVKRIDAKDQVIDIYQTAQLADARSLSNQRHNRFA